MNSCLGRVARRGVLHKRVSGSTRQCGPCEAGECPLRVGVRPFCSLRPGSMSLRVKQRKGKDSI